LHIKGNYEIEGGYQINLEKDFKYTKEEVKSLQRESEKHLLKAEDITDIQKTEREYQGETYQILTYKEKGQDMTAIQVPKKMRTIKVKDLELIKDLEKFKDKGRYPSFLAEMKSDQTLDQQRLIMGKNTETQKDSTDKYLQLQNKDKDTDIIREMIVQGKGMQSITDNAIMTQLIKQRF
jgi:hypothetical protein